MAASVVTELWVRSHILEDDMKSVHTEVVPLFTQHVLMRGSQSILDSGFVDIVACSPVTGNDLEAKKRNNMR
jgi:hypothetical protein